MKKLFALFLSGFLIVSIMSCGDDDDSSAYPLEGTVWEAISFVATNCDDPNDNDSNTNLSCSTTDCESLVLEDGDFVLTTKEDGITEVMEGTYQISGNVISVSFDEGEGTVSFDITYILVVNILTLDFTDPNGCDIIQIFEVGNS